MRLSNFFEIKNSLLTLKTVVVAVFIVLSFSLSAQNQKKADSLLSLLKTESSLKDSTKLEIYLELGKKLPNPDDVILYANKLRELAFELREQYYLGFAYQLLKNKIKKKK